MQLSCAGLAVSRVLVAACLTASCAVLLAHPLSGGGWVESDVEDVPAGWGRVLDPDCGVVLSVPPTTVRAWPEGDRSFWQLRRFRVPPWQGPQFAPLRVEVRYALPPGEVGGSGFVAGVVEVNCAPNSAAMDGAGVVDALLAEDHGDGGSIQVTALEEVWLWGRPVLRAHFDCGMRQCFGEETYYFSTAARIYMVRRVQMLRSPLMDDTTDRIFRNLRFPD